MEELLAKYFAQEATKDEEDTVKQWRAESQENSKAFLEYKKVWSSAALEEKPDTVLLSSILHDTPPEVIPLWNQKLFRIAVALIIGMGIIFSILMPAKEQPYGQVLTENTTFDLPDGSEVVVYRGGMLTLGSFESERKVSLTGKAYFDVKRDEDRPFTVKTKGALVQVLGTSFVVKSSVEEKVTEVLVESGKVALGYNPEAFIGKTMQVELTEGLMGELEIGKEGIRKRKIMDNNFLSWKTGVLSFRRDRLLDVAGTLEDVYDVEVLFANPALQNCRLTASFNQKKLDEVIKIISETFSISYSKNNHTITFSGDSCN